MPRKAKEIEENVDLKPQKQTTKKSTTKKTTKKASTTKKVTKEPKKAATKTATAKKTTTKKTTGAKKKTIAEGKVAATKTTKKTTRKTAKSSKSTLLSGESFNISEYYDLPYRYNQTIVKILAQTPTTLFIYWDISDEDREKYKKQYGDNFFELTKPVLIIKNETMNYTFEVDINDFANCWYLNVNDTKCKYKIELGRRPLYINNVRSISSDYIYISDSNEIESPNDHILFEKQQNMIYFKNAKTNEVTTKDFKAHLYFLQSIGKIYNVYDIYKHIYKDENMTGHYEIDLKNPSSGNPSSTFK